jgi:sulfite reductase alpha subunit-like flavoprotein
VLGLGESSYPQFCAIGRKLDARFAELGAKRLFAFAGADLDVDTVAGPWTRQALAQARDVLKSAATATNVTPLRPHVEATPWSASSPFKAEVLANQRITAGDSRNPSAGCRRSCRRSRSSWTNTACTTNPSTCASAAAPTVVRVRTSPKSR